MARTRILLDSNAYFRLARSIHPLLDVEFGDSVRYCLYVIDELTEEFARSRRLRNKFFWIDEAQYYKNRKRSLTISKQDRKSVEQAFDIIKNHARTEGFPTSPVDNHALATAYVLGIRLVTDDQDMLRLADDFEIRTQNTLQLMKLMLDADHIDMGRVRQVTEYWRYDKDIPANFKDDYLRLFAEEPPGPI